MENKIINFEKSYTEERLKFLLCLRMYMFDDYKMYKEHSGVCDCLEIYKQFGEKIDIISEYENRLPELQEKYDSIRAVFLASDMFNTGFVGETLGKKYYDMDKTQSIMILDTISADYSEFEKSLIETNHDTEKQYVDFFNIIMEMLEYGVLSYGIIDSTEDNHNGPLSKGNNVEIVICGSREPLVLYTNKHKKREDQGANIHWIEFKFLHRVKYNKNTIKCNDDLAYIRTRLVYYAFKNFENNPKFYGKDYYRVMTQRISDLFK